jgi:hypothetical protein
MGVAVEIGSRFRLKRLIYRIFSGLMHHDRAWRGAGVSSILGRFTSGRTSQEAGEDHTEVGPDYKS